MKQESSLHLPRFRSCSSRVWRLWAHVFTVRVLGGVLKVLPVLYLLLSALGKIAIL